MCEKTTVLAFDFGASSGRAIRAEFYDEHFTYKEVHRFENKPIEKAGHLRWDFDTLWREVNQGIAKAGHLDCSGFDTWGVDFGLLDQDGNLLELPVHYRDDRTIGMVEKAQAILSAEKLYTATGTQILAINTLFQLLALQQEDPQLLENAQTLLFMPDLFTYAISGRKVCEGTIASTAALVDPTTGTSSDSSACRKNSFCPLPPLALWWAAYPTEPAWWPWLAMIPNVPLPLCPPLSQMPLFFPAALGACWAVNRTCPSSPLKARPWGFPLNLPPTAK